MKYTAVTFVLSDITPEKAEILVAELSLFGFDSFEENEAGVIAYIPTEQWPGAGILEVLELMERYTFIESIDAEEMVDKNWNEVWESNFEPVVIADKCLIHASFHTNLPKCEYNILINPKMSFGAPASFRLMPLIDVIKSPGCRPSRANWARSRPGYTR